MSTFEKITIEATIHTPISTIWDYWNTPGHVTKWNNASPDWHTPTAENDFTVGGKFLYRMEAKDGSVGFDFWGHYDTIMPYTQIAYTMGDSRKVDILFIPDGEATKIVMTFEAETENPIEMQRGGWQAILDNFKVYAEENR
jgi:uncharacterized protein YndB with AHSA1/START domain